jgi:hypothetical protein
MTEEFSLDISVGQTREAVQLDAFRKPKKPRPPIRDKPLRILSLGAGVQSSAIALMIADGTLPAIDAAIFSDTQGEPRHTRVLDQATGQYIEGGIYGWLDWLTAKVATMSQPFPVHTVTAGNLSVDQAQVRLSGRTGRLYIDSAIPAFVPNDKGGKGLLARRCTADYKIDPIRRKCRELLGVERVPAGAGELVEMLIGISTDEFMRVKPSQIPWIRHHWPLIDDLGYSRKDCLAWMQRNGYPEPPRSACVFCPFHSDDEWKNLRDNSPLDFKAAVEAERLMQDAASRQNALTGIPYLHPSCKNIDEVEFADTPGHAQVDMFGNDCDGLCGV